VRLIQAKEAAVNSLRRIEVAGPRNNNWGWRRWTTWRNVGMVVAAVVLPFGWVLPVAQLARARVAARRARPF
jgi:hypothetical protein